MTSKIIFKTHGDPLDYTGGIHILTYAEEGFSPLEIHGRKLGVSRDTLATFSEAVNLANEVGSMFPNAPISAVPRSCIRDTDDTDQLVSHLKEFNNANSNHMKATILLIDFSTPRLPLHAQKAIGATFTDTEAAACYFKEIIVIRN